MNETETNFSTLVENVEKEMRRLGYMENSLRHYWEVWSRFRKYLSGRDFSEELCSGFLADVLEIKEIAAKNLFRQKDGARRAIKV